MSEAPNIPNIN